MEAPRPNPIVSGPLTVRFTLPLAEPARLELVDVAGRAVVTREVLGAGDHAVDLVAERRVPAGLYFVRLTQGANRKTARVTMLK